MTETVQQPRPAPAGTRKTPDRPCLNCGDPTPGNFCRHCGQRKIEVRVSLRRMLLEALDDQFSLNSALPRTLGALLFRPGRLTRDYMDGRIARYIPPFRLYLVCSVLFFLVLSFDLRYSAGGEGGLKVSTTDSAAVAGDSTGEEWMRGRASTGIPKLDSLVNARAAELSRMPPREAVKRVGGQFLEYVPQTMFLLLPLFAGIFKLLYLRRRRLYVEHFVFALHLHAFAFVSFTLIMAVPRLPTEVVLVPWMLLYTYLAMYRVYGQGWFRTAMKYSALVFSYTVLLTVALTGTLLIALALM